MQQRVSDVVVGSLHYSHRITSLVLSELKIIGQKKIGVSLR